MRGVFVAEGPVPVGPPLIDRSAELDRLAGLVTAAGERLITLTGPPGVGKTRLACAGAARLANDVVEEAALADLTTILDPGLILPEIRAALGLRTDAGRDPAALARALADRAVLVVLDNVEHVLPAAPTVAALLTSCPGLRIIATGRERLNLGAEHEFPVEPLAVPPPHESESALDSAALAAVPAVALLVERVRRFDPAFAVTAGNRWAITEICRLLDGLPLAIELAAARLRLYSPAELARLLRHRCAGLDGGAGDAPARHRNLDAAIGWSHDLLSDLERGVFRRAAVFVGGADLAAMQAVCDPGSDGGAIVDVVGSLLDKSLLQRSTRGDGATEVRMLESVRDHAVARLEAAGEGAVVRDRHADHFARWAVRVEGQIGTPGEGAAVAELGSERGNLGAALEHAVAGDLGPTVVLPLGFAAGLDAFIRGRLGEAAALLDRLLPEDDGAVPPSPSLVGIYVVAGATAYARGALGRAEHLLEHGIAVADAVDAPRWRAFATAFLGHVAGAHGHPDRAAAAYRRAGAPTPKRAARPARRGRTTTSACSPGDGRTRRARSGTSAPPSTASAGSATDGRPAARPGRSERWRSGTGTSTTPRHWSPRPSPSPRSSTTASAWRGAWRARPRPRRRAADPMPPPGCWARPRPDGFGSTPRCPSRTAPTAGPWTPGSSPRWARAPSTANGTQAGATRRPSHWLARCCAALPATSRRSPRGNGRSLGWWPPAGPTDRSPVLWVSPSARCTCTSGTSSASSTRVAAQASPHGSRSVTSRRPTKHFHRYRPCAALVEPGRPHAGDAKETT